MILITGGTGFIGKRLVEYLSKSANGEEIVCLVHAHDSEMEKTGREFLQHKGVRVIPVDLLSGKGLDQVPRSPQKIFHLASNTDTSAKDHSINDVGTTNLLKAIEPLNASTHFIFTSSIAVNDHRENYSIPITEETSPPERPCHEYGRKKLLTEKILKAKAKEAGFNLSIVRVCGVYGEGVRKGGLFDSIKELVPKGSMLMRLNWPGRISLVHVDDMAKFLIKVSERKPKEGQEVYLPAVEALSVAEMSQVMHKAYGLPYREIRLPNMFWRTLSLVARKKRFLERILPHGMYNRCWQAFLLVNHEYWNESLKIKSIFNGYTPTRFEQYYNSSRVGKK